MVITSVVVWVIQEHVLVVFLEVVEPFYLRLIHMLRMAMPWNHPLTGTKQHDTHQNLASTNGRVKMNIVKYAM
jgi:hypothetical protein